MKKKSTLLIAGLALAFTGLSAQESPDFEQIVEDVRAIEDKAEANADRVTLGDQYGPDLLAALEAGESLGHYESLVFFWYWKNPGEESMDTAVAKTAFERVAQLRRAQSWTVRTVARNDIVTDQELADWIGEPGMVRRKILTLTRWNDWDDPAQRDSLLESKVKAEVGKGHSRRWWEEAFKAVRSGLPLAEQISLTQQEVNGLIGVADRNSHQDKWLTEASADLMALKLQQ